MKISFVTTVFNEEKTIDSFLKSLVAQTKKPNEIIIIDGGSADKTVAKIKKWKKNSSLANDRLKIRLLVKKGATIAQGRNVGIEKAKSEIVAISDAGCILYPDWLENITKPFKNPKIDLVAGFYQMTSKNIFQKCLACYLGVLPERLNPENFMPSTRSIAFRKKVWQKIGGFNEKLKKTGEDTLFNYQAKKLGFNFFTAKDALVSWQIPSTWKEAWKKIHNYAKGDAQAGIWWHPSQKILTHNLRISFIYIRYLLGLIFLILGFSSPIFWVLLAIGFTGYLFWAILKNYRYVRAWQAFFILPILQIISDFAVMLGFLIGSLSCIINEN